MNNFEDMEPITGEIQIEDKEEALDLLKDIEDILKCLDKKDPDYAYADTGDSMDRLDVILENVSGYENSLEARVAATAKIINGSEDEKEEGLREVRSWLEEVRSILN